MWPNLEYATCMLEESFCNLLGWSWFLLLPECQIKWKGSSGRPPSLPPLHLLTPRASPPQSRTLQIRQWHHTPVLLPGNSYGRRSLVGCSPWGPKSRTWLSDFTFTFHFHALGKEMATHSSVLAWRIPGTGEPGGLPSMGSHRVGHDCSDLAAAAAAYSLWREGIRKYAAASRPGLHHTEEGSGKGQEMKCPADKECGFFSTAHLCCCCIPLSVLQF